MGILLLGLMCACKSTQGAGHRAFRNHGRFEGAVNCFDAHPDEGRGYHVEWRWYVKDDETGDRLEIYPRRVENSDRAHKHPAPLYTFFQDRVAIDSVTSWVAPELHPGSSGVLLTTHGGAGSGKRFLLLASDDGRRFRVLLDVVSGRAGETGGLEVVDVDGDGYPELITIADYSSFPDAAIASIWKWSPAKRRYLLLRKCPYAERLRRPQRVKRSPRSRCSRL